MTGELKGTLIFIFAKVCVSGANMKVSVPFNPA